MSDKFNRQNFVIKCTWPEARCQFFYMRASENLLAGWVSLQFFPKGIWLKAKCRFF